MSNGWRLVSAKSETRKMKADSGIQSHEPRAALHRDGLRKTQRALPSRNVDPKEDRQHGQRHRQFVRDQLRRSPDAPEKGIFGIGGPAGDDERIDTERGDGENAENADVHMREHERHNLPCRIEVGAEGHRHHGHQRRGQCDHRSEHIVELVNVAGNGFLFEKELRPVGQKMEDAEALEERSEHRNPGDPRHGRAVRTGTALHPRGNLALRHRTRPGERKDHHDHRQPFERALNPERKLEEEIHLRGARSE